MAKKQDRYKGKVGVSSYKGRLRLSLPRQVSEGKKQKFIYLGLSDSPQNRKLAEAKAKLIESDITYERFDSTLEKYLPKSFRIEKCSMPTLLEIYQRFTDARRQTVRPGTWRNGYKVMLGHLERSPFARSLITEAGLAQKLVDWSRTNLTPDTAQRFCTQLNAAVKWAIDSRLITQIEKSPFEGLAKKLKPTKGDKEIYPFLRAECELIINYFEANHFHYSDFIKFLFWTGCRPSEALALKWEDVAKDFSKIIFTSAIVPGEGGLEEVDGLKTQKKRSFPCNERLKEILKNRFQNSGKGYVFTGQGKDSPLNLGYVRKLWRKCLTELGIEYRKIYQCRHTFITLCLANGLLVQDVARLVGNSPAIVYRHYAGVSNVEIPEF